MQKTALVLLVLLAAASAKTYTEFRDKYNECSGA